MWAEEHHWWLGLILPVQLSIDLKEHSFSRGSLNINRAVDRFNRAFDWAPGLSTSWIWSDVGGGASMVARYHRTKTQLSDDPIEHSFHPTELSINLSGMNRSIILAWCILSKVVGFKVMWWRDAFGNSPQYSSQLFQQSFHLILLA